MIMVKEMAAILHNVHAPAPALGKPSMPAPTQTLAIIHAPPRVDGLLMITPYDSLYQ